MQTDFSTPTRETWMYERIASQLLDLIQRGTYTPGQKLPSIRETCVRFHVSPTTATQAFRLLENQGWVEARPQSGYYVGAGQPQLDWPGLDPKQNPPVPRPVTLSELAVQLMRDTQRPGFIQLGAAVPHPDMLPVGKLNQLMISLIRNGGENHAYADSNGVESLRVQIAQRLVLNGAHLGPEDVIITSGCTEALSLSLRAVCQAGDIVAVETPTYYWVLRALEGLGLRALEIPTHPRDGVSLEALELAFQNMPVRACLFAPNFSNPLGCSMPEENKKNLMELLIRYQVPLIEDAIYNELYFGSTRPAPLKNYDTAGLVMMCSSVSKYLSPDYRVGWVIPGRFKDEVAHLKYLNNLSDPSLPQLTVAKFLSNGGYDHHMRRIRRIYARQMWLMARAIQRYFPAGTRVSQPDGGFVLWVQMPESVNALDLYYRAIEEQITLAPGFLFSNSQRYQNCIRLNATYWSLPVERAVEKLGKLAGK